MSKSHLTTANSHRAKEGARVLEDIARFVLRDEKLFRQIRDLRHRIPRAAPLYDIEKDAGGISLIEDNVRSNIINIIQANALRLQEALRVLEEMETSVSNKQSIKELRYNAYDLHAKLYSTARQYLKLDLLQGAYLIIDTDIISCPLEEIIDTINQSSIHIVQYRNKSGPKKTIFENAYKIKQQLDCHKLFIMNDHIDIALDLADGIHIGQNDYPLERVRNMVPDDFILGISCHGLKEARIAMQCGASYIAIGCLFETKSKQDIIPVSIQELQQVCDEAYVPVCAIGGINIHNLGQVLTANIKMAAFISYVWKTDCPLQAINDMHKKIMRCYAS